MQTYFQGIKGKFALSIFRVTASFYTVGVDIFCRIWLYVPRIQYTRGKEGKYTTSVPNV